MRACSSHSPRRHAAAGWPGSFGMLRTGHDQMRADDPHPLDNCQSSVTVCHPLSVHGGRSSDFVLFRATADGREGFLQLQHGTRWSTATDQTDVEIDIAQPHQSALHRAIDPRGLVSKRAATKAREQRDVGRALPSVEDGGPKSGFVGRFKRQFGERPPLDRRHAGETTPPGKRRAKRLRRVSATGWLVRRSPQHCCARQSEAERRAPIGAALSRVRR